MKRVIVSFAKKNILLLLGLVFIALLVSCEYFEVDVRTEVIEKIDSATFQTFSSLSSQTKNSAGAECIPWNTRDLATGQIRNARGYKLEVHYNFTDGSKAREVVYKSISEYTSASQNDYDVAFVIDEMGAFKAYFSSYFLHGREINTNLRDISGSIMLADSNTKREFERREISLRVNTPPSAVSDYMLQRDSDTNKYVVCFMMPNLTAIDAVHADTHILNMDGTDIYFSSNNFDGTFYTDAALSNRNMSFTTVRPQNLCPVKDDGELFQGTRSETYIPVYYLTDVGLTTQSKLWHMYLKDDEGLCSSIATVSNNALEVPVLQNSLENGNTYDVDVDGDGEFVIRVSHSGKCINGTSAGGSVVVRLVALAEDGTELLTLDRSVSADGEASFGLERGNYSTIKIYAKRAGFSSSDPIILRNITIRQAPTFYVSPAGSNSNRGTKNSPFLTIDHAINAFLDDFTDETTCNVYLLGNVDLASGITIPSRSAEKTISIRGYGDNRTIDAKQRGSAITVQNGANLRLGNVTITGGSAVNGGGILVEAGACVTIMDSTVTDNTASGNGGGIYVTNEGTLNIQGKLIIIGNTRGTAVNNIYLCEGTNITISDELDVTSEIGITTAVDPTAGSPVVFTSGFSAGNTSSCDMFFGDKGFVAVRSGDEAALSKNGAIIPQIGDDITISCDKTAASSSDVLTFSVSNDELDITDDVKNTFSFIVRCGGTAVPASYVTQGTGENKNKLTLNNLPQDTYTVIAVVRYNNMTYSWSCNISVRENSSSGSTVPVGFVAVTGATVSGAVGSGDAASAVFVAGRSVMIPNMYVSDHEVTQKEWYDVFGVTQAEMDSEHNNGRGNCYPVYSVNWYGAIAYCNKKSVADGLTPCYSVSGITNWATFSYISIPTSSNDTWNAATCNFNANGYRLPTEAEWEYIARGGNNGIPATQTTYSGSNSVSTVAWYGNSSGNSDGTAHEVTDKISNSLNVYDMSGNVWELCWDWYSESVSNSTPSVGVSAGTDRVVRGGSWSNSETDCTVATRWAAPSGFSINDCIGFRVVRTDGSGSGGSSSSGGGSGGSAPNGFVAVTGATVTGAIGSGDAASRVFIAGRTVTIPNMYVSDHEVTQAEYQAVMGANPSNFTSNPANGETQANRPVEEVSWYAAIAYCNKKSVADGLTPCYTVSGITNWATFSYNSIPTSNNETWNAATCNFNANGYRLPTEAEWEYVARGGNGLTGTQTTYSGTNSDSDLTNYAWYTTNSGNKTHEVRKKNANSLGIYDMTGNVWEWCWDWHGDITSGTAATGASSGSYRVIRGGGWLNYASYCRVADHRYYNTPDDADDYLGFRVVRTVQ